MNVSLKNISSISDDSRKAKRGGLFVAIKGQTVDSHKFIDQVIKKGVSVVVGEKKPKKAWLEKAEYIQVENSRKALGELAAEFYDHPSKKMTVIGVTGTDGKTTTSYFCYQILKSAGLKVGLISTVGAYIGDQQYDTGFHVTNPEALELQKFLAKMVKEGCEYIIIETTSHGLEQERVAGVDYDIGILTNITKEHLDYHKTFSNLVNTKSKLFERSKIAILNKDDSSSKKVIKKLDKQKVIYYTKLDNLKTNITADYNLHNLSAAITLAKQLKISNANIKKAIEKLKLPEGRLQKVNSKKNEKIYIDFAHTTNSLKHVLTELRKMTDNKLIVVFGCAGERDTKKRPEMGKVATDIADFAIFTAEDPRHENLDDIISQMSSKVKDRSKYKIIKDRFGAIKHAIEIANKGDIVVVTGKGHEQSMNINGVEKPWSDKKAVKKILKNI